MKLGKKKIKKNVNITLTLFIFVIAFLETVFYYQDEITNIVYLLLLSIFNGVTIFGMNSSIDIFDIINVQSNDFGIFRRVLDTIYTYCYFLAPIITINYVSRLINYLAKGKLSFVSLRKCERIVIVGYNRHVENLAKDIIESNKKRKKKQQLVILHKNEIPESNRIIIQMAGVLIKKYDKLDFGMSNVRDEILTFLKPERVKNIILFEEVDMDNFSNYMFFLNCFKFKNHCGFISNIKIDCNYNLTQVEELIWNCYEKGPVDLKYRMNTFSIPMLRAQAVIDKCQKYKNVMNTKDECSRDIHILIIGFGRMGRRLLKRVVNQSVVSDSNKIVIDIIEKDINKARCYLKEQCNYYDNKTNSIHIGSDILEGDLLIRLHELDINDVDFTIYLERLSEVMPFTYFTICIDDSESGVKCMLNIENYLQKKKMDVPILMRMDSGQQLQDLESIYRNILMVPGDDEIITMENIRSQTLELITANVHKKDDIGQMDRTKYAYQIETRKYRMLHYEVKEAIVNILTNSDKQHIQNLFSSSDYMEKSKRGEFVKRVKEDKLLQMMGAIEHRRWGYYMVLNGWKYKKVKDEESKTTPYLCSFIDILNSPQLQSSVYYEYKDWDEIVSKM